MEWKIIHIEETDSTNRWLRDYTSGASTDSPCQSVESGASLDAPVAVVVANYQTAGRGCGTNTWESERGKNLLFSVLLHPKDVAANQQFRLSMAVSLAICEALDNLIGNVSIKWPNDIYWRNGKICGILIEQTLQGNSIKDCIVGVGLNVNQQRFVSGAPNPVSLWQICEQETDREALLRDILVRLERILGEPVRDRYLSRLYRRQGFHPYVDSSGVFMAEIADVEDDGHLVLSDDSGSVRRYAFKEVQFII